jgi:hypothetical protein
MKYLPSLALLSLVCLLSACSFQTAGADRQQATVRVPTVEVTVEVVPPELYPPPTPVICTSSPTSVTLSAKPVSPTALQLDMGALKGCERFTALYILAGIMPKVIIPLTDPNIRAKIGA